MQAEKSIQVDHSTTRNVDGRTHGVIGLLAMWHHDIQSVGRASLEDDHKPLVVRASFDGREGCTGKKSGDRRRTHNRHRAIAKKYSASDRHRTSAFSRQLSVISKITKLRADS